MAMASIRCLNRHGFRQFSRKLLGKTNLGLAVEAALMEPVVQVLIFCLLFRIGALPGGSGISLVNCSPEVELFRLIHGQLQGSVAVFFPGGEVGEVALRHDQRCLMVTDAMHPALQLVHAAVTEILTQEQSRREGHSAGQSQHRQVAPRQAVGAGCRQEQDAADQQQPKARTGRDYLGESSKEDRQQHRQSQPGPAQPYAAADQQRPA